MKLSMNMNDQSRKYLMITGIVIGAAALLTYPAIQLVKMIRSRRNKTDEQEDTNQVKSFAPSYRGSHKPHHRKAEANGHLHQHN